MYFTQNIKYLADKSRWKNVDLAERLNITPTQVGAYMKGKSFPKLEGIIEIARLFNINIDDLLLKDLTQETGRPFGAEGEDKASTDETLVRMNELLEQRVKVIEMALKRSDPGLAKELGID
jgi:transcriptional regulator with XRE-family HTH domain